MNDRVLSFLFIFLIFSGDVDAYNNSNKLKPAIQNYTTKAPKVGTYRQISFKVMAKFNRKKLFFADQSKSWKLKMRKIGSHLKRVGVHSIYLVHGTFVGNDPFGAAFLLKALIPNISPLFIKKIHKFTLKNNEFLYRDLGHYSSKYIQLLQLAFSSSIVIKRFNWSSENHHVARLKGVIDLVNQLYKDLCRVKSQKIADTNKRKIRILLLGHSHAGQLFALFSHFLKNSIYVEPLLRVLMPYGKERLKFRHKLKCLRKFYFDITTFGTPPRYTWAKYRKIRLLNIINHRMERYLGAKMFGICLTGECSGFLNTKYGDYIQQWGIAGTDVLLASNPADQKANKKLNQLLGAGTDLLSWSKWVKLRMRVPHFGFTYLVDYKDNSAIFPNCFQTLFGHGIYTRYQTMLFNFYLIEQFFYGKKLIVKPIKKAK